MSRFAKVEEEAINRQSELTGEEFRLYTLIKYHTWSDSGICNKNLHELSKIYGLNYDHTTARYKSLRAKGWCEKTRKGIRPIAGLKTSKIEVLKTSESEVLDDEKLQKPKFQTSESEVFEDEKLQKPKFPFVPYIEPFKDESFSTATTTEKSVVVGETNGHKSQFSIEECRRYVQLCERDGQTIKNRFGLENYLFETGEKDALILARLYPEPPTFSTAALTGKRAESLAILLDVLASDMDIAGFEQYETPEDWAWLMEELKNVERS